MRTDTEIIAVRADEHLDISKLEPWLRENLSNAQGSLNVSQFGGGHANLTYLVGFEGAEYVLRRPPLGPVAPSAHDMLREHRVLKNLWRQYPLAPRSYVACKDKSIIGAEFHVMERRQGFVIRKQLPASHNWTQELNKRVGHMLVDSLSQLHSVDPEAAGLGDLGRPQGFIERQLAGWAKRWQAASHEPNPKMESIITWLENNQPDSSQISLLHNDFKLDNLLVDIADPATAVAVLDWDMCTRGDPLMDLGFLLTYWNEPNDNSEWIKAASMPTWNTGFPTREQVIERYAKATGFACDQVHWYHIFGIFKIAVILQQIYVRYQNGQTLDERFAIFGDRITGLIDKAQFLSKT